MRDTSNVIEDILSLGGNLFGNALGARHEVKAQIKQRGETIARVIGLVSREEFDAAFAMLAKARNLQDDIRERLKVIERRLGIKTARTAPQKSRASMKANLPSVKKDERRKKRVN